MHLLLAEFDFTYIRQKSVKGQEIIDSLAENSINGYQPINDLSPDEVILNVETEKEHPNWRITLMEQ